MAKHRKGTITEILARHYRKCRERQEKCESLQDKRKSAGFRAAASKRMKRLWTTRRDYLLGIEPLPPMNRPAITQGDYVSRRAAIKTIKDQYYKDHPEIPYGS